MKKILYSITLCFLLVNVHAQQRYAYLPEGKTVFQTSYKKLIIKYKNELKTGQLSRFVTDSSLNKADASRKWNVLDFKNCAIIDKLMFKKLSQKPGQLFLSIYSV